ncbi:MAG: methyltransferase domain-containing protein [Acidobacteria bacterium]|nr:methyltransferase domain-containing protein [Acidobacteriota bacterium]MBS1865021.1 methyltransferase domain-containing protein [Acidobacteriota bacterium]
MLKAYLKRSHLVLGFAKVLRGLRRDILVVYWLTKRGRRTRKYLEQHAVKKLQLGTSNNVLEGWLNTDVFLNHSPVVYLDATRRFPFKDNTFDYVMSEHMIEHVEYSAGQVMLAECYRVLKPGGRLRFATPDMSVLLALHREEKSQEQNNYIDFLIGRLMPEVTQCKDVFIINNCFRAWGHNFLYDQRALRHALSSVGFREIGFHKSGESDDPLLRNLETHGKEVTEEINRFETVVVEAVK